MSGSKPEEKAINEVARKLLSMVSQSDLTSDEKLMLLALSGLIEADDDNWLTDVGYEAMRQLVDRLGKTG